MPPLRPRHWFNNNSEADFSDSDLIGLFISFLLIALILVMLIVCGFVSCWLAVKGTPHPISP
jgi:hypothetical protein